MARISPSYHSHICPSCEQSFECDDVCNATDNPFCESCPRRIHVKCRDERGSFDQRVREIYLERMDDQGFWGRPVANPDCPTLLWPKFAWKEVFGVCNTGIYLD